MKKIFPDLMRVKAPATADLVTRRLMENTQLSPPEVAVVKLQDTAATIMQNRKSDFLPIESIVRAITENRNCPSAIM